MQTSLEELTVQHIQDAVRKSLALEDNQYIHPDTPLIALHSQVEPADLLEVFQEVGITPMSLKFYLTDGGLTEEGRNYLKQATKGLTSKPTMSLYHLADTKSLDDFTKQITPNDIYNIATYRLRG
ncbi:hypothetical protein HOE04_05040 [archaeon]|jgi:hypothetical protein|nr:hypothetical protein [archaeon]